MAAKPNPAVAQRICSPWPDSLTEAAGGAAVIEDRLSRVLAYSKLQQPADAALVATIMGGCAPQRLRAFFEARGVFAHLAAPTSPTDTIACKPDGLPPEPNTPAP